MATSKRTRGRATKPPARSPSRSKGPTVGAVETNGHSTNGHSTNGEEVASTESGGGIGGQEGLGEAFDSAELDAAIAREAVIGEEPEASPAGEAEELSPEA